MGQTANRYGTLGTRHCCVYMCQFIVTYILSFPSFADQDKSRRGQLCSRPQNWEGEGNGFEPGHVVQKPMVLNSLLSLRRNEIPGATIWGKQG